MHSQVSVFLNAFRELSAIAYAFANAAKIKYVLSTMGVSKESISKF